MNVIAVILLTLAANAVAQAETYTIDPTHTYAHFSISHNGFSTLRGSFDRCSGTVTLDTAAQAGSVDIAFETASVHTGLAMRDAHLRSADYFDADKFPLITYRSDHMTFQDGKPVSVEGNLTLKGVTRPVALKISAFRCGIHPFSGKDACGADASAHIRRSDFGIVRDLPGVGDEIDLQLEVEANKDNSMLKRRR